ncbi:hypothetical protein OV207_26180 [Corallococcus sp. BB11-1]|uniref:hypothetical protein n=1 Tax=Corallococcus sp. BB11-1 TaxID=2996783 RepID=UPI00226E3A37|nr:hypothetical protein [Corallococcus sp. BB11-1]MCY1034962.1 hypothetical protein [Corallococcus sp. BB11-1]
MNASRFLAGLLFSLTLLIGAEASAQSCTTLVNSQFSWVQQGGGYFLHVTGVTLKPATGSVGAVASHFTGSLSGYVAQSWYLNPITGTLTRIPARITSPANSGRQGFNDRGYSSTQGGVTRYQNFSVFAQDNIQLGLDDTGKMTITFNTWGNGQITLASPTCSGNVLTGFSGSTMYAFTFEQFYLG